MTQNIYGMTEAELFRPTTAYTAIKDPAIRAEFLQMIEAWARDQWCVVGCGTQADV
ncbi:hypothetical protein [Thalassovita sp.]|uniref:hypothetical protein n=1 Tax=Thalassovita sp. TaxID=1979401 RepID=UPI0028825FF5|nr:hypothetical protein [Thalassovita sp.]MDF1804362.1 hypothetical protein [Thalassovita sp.]